MESALSRKRWRGFAIQQAAGMAPLVARERYQGPRAYPEDWRRVMVVFGTEGSWVAIKLPSSRPRSRPRARATRSARGIGGHRSTTQLPTPRQPWSTASCLSFPSLAAFSTKHGYCRGPEQRRQGLGPGQHSFHPHVCKIPRTLSVRRIPTLANLRLRRC